jgi:hypothetical protein
MSSALRMRERGAPVSSTEVTSAFRSGAGLGKGDCQPFPSKLELTETPFSSNLGNDRGRRASDGVFHPMP